MTRTRCFFLEPVAPVAERRWLRRYSQGGPPDVCPAHPGQYSYHDASRLVGDFDVEANEERDRPDHADPRWPSACACGYAFLEADVWQLFTNRLYRRTDTGEVMTLREAPAGAIWNAHWYGDHPSYRGPDGRTLVCKLPGGHEWVIDGRASNCTLPQDTAHKCWVRHGEPPDLTVDKNGVTCAAGAGSILSPDGKWHGFLRAGYLEQG